MKLTPKELADQRGFTLVEILIVLVIIALLVIGSIPFIGRAQADARDDRRASDIAAIAAALESYYYDNNEYPVVGGSTVHNSYWTTTADDSWDGLRTALVPKYIKELPSDPSGDKGKLAIQEGQAYDYFAVDGVQCGVEHRQTYILYYRFEARPQASQLNGTCSSPTYSNTSYYRTVHDAYS